MRPARFVPAALLLLAPAAFCEAAPRPLTPAEHDKIIRAIDRGASYLRSTQHEAGHWPRPRGTHTVGYALVRRSALRSDATYELALSLVFLDQLDDPRDTPLIQALAVRLIAGQTATGGWGYKCPTVPPETRKRILTTLRKLNPRPPAFVFERPRPGAGKAVPVGPLGSGPRLTSVGKTPGGPALIEVGKGPAEKVVPERGPAEPVKEAPGLVERPGKAPGKEKAPGAPEGKGKPAPKPAPLTAVPPSLRGLPVFQDPALHLLRDQMRKVGKHVVATTDNSNTQFAILALWAAQRHDVPMERSLRLMVRRYQTSQNADGSWSYHYVMGGGLPEGPAMTAVGLIGLAVGHGLAGKRDRVVRDPAVAAGIQALSQHVRNPAGRMVRLPQPNLYLLWSIERAAVAFGLSELGGKDWYRWGAECLVANQGKKGEWRKGGYPGASPTIDTCLALLFLNRVNLTEGLREHLPFMLEGRAADAAPPKAEKLPGKKE